MDISLPLALVVDDDPLVLMFASDLIAEAGFTPVEATSVHAALKLLEEHETKVLILFTDVQMPGGRDGFSLAREARERWPDIHVIVASGRAWPEENDMPDGARFVSKPYCAKVVHGHLREMLPVEHQPEMLRLA